MIKGIYLKKAVPENQVRLADQTHQRQMYKIL